ncbi:lamin tail domain-containing protein [Chryseobacterium sp. MEBOG07]|uniref:lamin tail domain-containing protein n=1 Tax=Chryseobacterium sp. MEBOG07 TaxID=2879939 RepID=UPI001F36E11F|nr:lamin tail domain-containing protein [Chryseobacterium sp. MEBOG07]UKB80432.1 lamin tail domain-containing protein [Chryseobacterium sp. MEBOG07]
MKKIFTILGLISATAFMNAQIVINEVYGGGGNSGATLKNDFVELINRGASSVTITGAYLQYTSAAGAFGPSGSNTNPLNNKLALPSITLNPGQKYLIQLAVGNGGTQNLPNPDFAPSGTSFPDQPLALSGTGGKIALTSDSTSPTAANGSNVIDFVGWGTGVSLFEGTAAAPATTNTTSISRTNGIDTNNNNVDFTAGTPTPENSSSGTLAVIDTKNAKSGSFVKNSFVKNNEIVFGSDVKDVKVFNMFGQLVKEASVKQNGTVSVAELAKGNYVVTGTVNNQPISQKVLKD